MAARATKAAPGGHPRRRAGGRHRLPSKVEPAASSGRMLEELQSATLDEEPLDGEFVEGLGEDAQAETEEPTAAPDDEVADGEDAARETPSSRSAPAPGRWQRRVGFSLLPAMIVSLGACAGYLTWDMFSAHLREQARVDSVHAASDGTVALLTYGPDTADKQLSAARERLTGSFKSAYTMYTHQVVIPDASQKRISSVVDVPAAASVSTTNHAVVVLYVNQTFLRDPDPPTSTVSTVRVTLDKVGKQWLISDFKPL